MRRLIKVAGVLVSVVVLGAMLLVGVAAQTDFGRERVRRIALHELKSVTNGRLSVTRIEGNLLGRFSLVGLSITDSAGTPFVLAERLTTRLSITRLLDKRVSLSDIELINPQITIEQDESGRWNYDRIFPSDTAAGDTTAGFGDWVTLDNVAIRNGRLMIVRPWAPGGTMAQRDSLTQDALSNQSRLRVERRGDRYVRLVTLEQLTAIVPTAIIAAPNEPDMRFDVDSLRALVALYRPPLLDVRQVAGTLRIAADSIWASPLSFALPASNGSGTLSINSATGDIHAKVDISRFAFADVRPMYEALPDSGGGRLRATLVVRDTSPSEFVIHEADIAVGVATVRGNLAVTLGDSVMRFEQSQLTFQRVHSRLVDQFVPDIAWPFTGELSGEAKFSGALEALQVDLRAAVRPDRYAPFAVSARGGAGIDEGFTARRLQLRAERVPLALARAFAIDQPVGGVLSADGTIEGSTNGLLTGTVKIRHDEGVSISRATVRGSVALQDDLRVNLSAQLHSVALAVANHFVDSLNVQGAIAGDIELRGTSQNLLAQLALSLPGDGRLTGSGSYRKPPNDSAAYRADIALQNVAPQAMIPSLPIMLLDGTATLHGTGLTLASADATLRSRMDLFMIDSAEVRNIVLDARARDGLLSLDTLSGVTSFGALSASGTFGLVGSTDGELTYAGRVDDLRGLTRWIATGDTSSVTARPAIGVRAARFRERMDSLRVAAREQEDPAAALAASVRDPRPGGRRAAEPIPDLARDSTWGSFQVRGTARGNIERASVAATVTTPGIVWDGNLLGAGSVKVDWLGAFTDTDTLRINGGADSVQVAGFAFDSTQIRGTYRRGEGSVAVALFPGDTSVYRFNADFALRTGEGELRLRDVDVTLDSTHWKSSRTSTVSWREQGIRIDSLELRDTRADSRLFVNGEIPDVDPGRLDVVAENVRVGPWLAIAQSNVEADGRFSAVLALEGTKSAPRLNGTMSLTNSQYGGTPFPDIDATLKYAARELAIDAVARNSIGRQIAQVTGTVPIDLALDSVAERLPKTGQLALRLRGDSIPLTPLQEFTDAVTDVQGLARGDITLGGTWDAPAFSGTASLDMSQVRLAATGVLMNDVSARLRMSVDSVLIDTLTARSGGRIAGAGVLVLSPMENPTLQLTMTAADARVLNNEQGELFADGTIRALGTLDSLNVTGDVAITRGVIYVPDPTQAKVIDTQDPAIFAIADSATIRELGLSGTSPLAQSLRLDVGVDVRRGTFGRSPEANVEVYGNLRVRTEPPREAFLVTGSLYSDRGQYTLYGKRFDVTRGSVRFIGGEEINPSLQLLATYQVQQAGRAPLDIHVVIGGTVEQPTVSLESDAQPTLSQSDIISFLAFGRSSSSLLQFTGTGLEGGGAGGSSLAGNVAALATRQLASIGIGALVDEVRADIASATGADVLNITPAQLPADVSLSALETVLRGTELEIGRYVNERTFVIARVRPSLILPGATIEHRFGERLRARASLETRLQATTPTLGRGVEPRALQVLGGLLTWTFVW